MKNKINLSSLINGFLIMGVFLELGGLILGNKILFEKPPEWYSALITLLSLPWIFTYCICIIKFKEVPRFGLPSIKGWWAVLQGYLGAISIGLLEIYFIYIFVFELYKMKLIGL